MPKDIVVVVRLDDKPKEAQGLDILLVSTEGEKAIKTYRSLEEIAVDFSGKNVEKMAQALFDQGKTTLADGLIRKVKIVGLETPESASAMVESLEALRQQDDDWYLVLTDKKDDEYIRALAAWAEGTEPTEAELEAGIEDHRKLYFAQTANKSLSVTNRRSVIVYHSDEEEAAAAWVGNVGPFYPQSVTWKFKQPQGITLQPLTDAEREALEEANINFLSVEYKRKYMKNGVCADGEYIDSQMGADYIALTIRENLYNLLIQTPKVPYTNQGFVQVASAVFSALNRAVEYGIIAKDPESKKGMYLVNVPTRADATDDQARAREMPPITWEAQLEGAVHRVKVTGTLKATVDFE